MKIFISLAGIAIALIATGCQRGPKAIVPDQETARQQYMFAKAKQDYSIPPANSRAMAVHREKHKFLFQKVVNRFPDDPIYTPRAILEIAEILFKERRYVDTILYLRKAMPLYPNMPEFQAQAIYLIGWSFDKMQRHEQAKEEYKKCIDQFGQSDNPAIQDVVTKCRRFYNRTHIINQ